MANATSDRLIRTSGETMIGNGHVPAEAATYYAGTMLGYNKFGRVEKMSRSTPFAGLVHHKHTVQSTGATLFMERPTWAWCPRATAAQSDVGTDVQATDDQTIEEHSGVNFILGTVHDFLPQLNKVVFNY